MTPTELIEKLQFSVDSDFILPSNWAFNEDQLSTENLFFLKYKQYPSVMEFKIPIDSAEAVFTFLREQEYKIFSIINSTKYDETSSSIFTHAHGTMVFISSFKAFSITDSGAISVNSSGKRDKFNLTIRYNLSDIEQAKKLRTLLLSKERKEGNIHLFEKDEYNEMHLQEYDIDGFELDIDKHYNDDFKDINDKILKWAGDWKTTNKRLSMLSGLPGTGKTNYIKYLLNQIPDVRKIYIPPYFVASIADPAFMGFIKQYSNSLIILEDAEKILTSREVDSENVAMSILLNLTDGILASVLNFKIICTFNTDEKNIDDALKRKGRLFTKYKFDKLCERKTSALFKEKHGADAIPPQPKMTIADIFNIEDNGTIQREEPRKIGF